MYGKLNVLLLHGGSQVALATLGRCVTSALPQQKAPCCSGLPCQGKASGDWQQILAQCSLEVRIQLEAVQVTLHVPQRHTIEISCTMPNTIPTGATQAAYVALQVTA